MLLKSYSTYNLCVFVFCRFFSILYIHSFVYTVYDDLAGRRPGHSGESAAHVHTDHTATETASGTHQALVLIHKHEHTHIYTLWNSSLFSVLQERPAFIMFIRLGLIINKLFFFFMLCFFYFPISGYSRTDPTCPDDLR